MNSDIARIIREIDQHPDKLHSDYTPSVHRLIEIGETALDPVLELMLLDRRETRLRAQRVIEGITMKLFGFEVGHGWKSEQDSLDWQIMWHALGNLDYDDSQEKREASVDLWKQWISQHSQNLQADNESSSSQDNG